MSVKLREKALKDGRRSFYLDLYQNGRRAYEFLEIYLTKDKDRNRESRALAESVRAKRELELQASNHGLSPQFKRKTDFLVYFQRFYEDKEKFEGMRGVSNYKTALKHIKGYAGALSISIGSIDKDWIEGFKSYLVEKAKMRPNTANNYLVKVKAALSKAVKEGFIPKSPAEDVKYFPNPEVEKEFLTAQEVATLATTPCEKPHVKLAFLFGCHTGLRFSDIKALTWGDIKDGKIHFRQRKTLGYEYLPLNTTALSILEQCKDKNTVPLPAMPVFFGLMDKSHISFYLSPWLKAAKITKHVSFHASRHTFATSLLTAGADLYTVSKLLGHKSISTTAVYAKIIDSKKLNAVESLQQVEVVG